MKDASRQGAARIPTGRSGAEAAGGCSGRRSKLGEGPRGSSTRRRAEMYQSEGYAGQPSRWHLFLGC